MDDFQSILENGISFKGSSGPKKEDDKVKTKAKKKKYVTGAHGSGSAKQKAKYRQQRANRHKSTKTTNALVCPSLSKGFEETRAFVVYFIYSLKLRKGPPF